MSDGEHFFPFFRHLYVVLEDMSTQVLSTFFNWVVTFCGVWGGCCIFWRFTSQWLHFFLIIFFFTRYGYFSGVDL